MEEEKKRDHHISMKLSKDAEFSNYTTKSSTSDTGSLKESDRKKWRNAEILLLEEKFPSKSYLKKKQFRTNPSTPKIEKKQNPSQFLFDWKIWNTPVEEQQEENCLESNPPAKQSKLKMVVDDEEFNTKSRNRFQSDEQWKQRCKSLEALAQVEEEDLVEPQESLINYKKVQAFLDKNEFNGIGSSIQLTNSNIQQLCVQSIQEDDEFKQDSPTHHRSSILKTLETKLESYKLKIDELDKGRRKKLVQQNQLEVLEEAKEEEDDDQIFCRFAEYQYLTKLRSEEKQFLKKILKGEQVTSMEQLFEFLEKEPDQPTTPIEELQEEDEPCKNQSH